MASYVTTVDLYERPNFDLQPDTTLDDALETAAWARGEYQPGLQFAGYSHEVYISYEDDDSNRTLIRRWRWASRAGGLYSPGYWFLVEINEVPDSE